MINGPAPHILVFVAVLNFAATMYYVSDPYDAKATENARNGVQIASALEKTGKWAEAAEIYETVASDYSLTPYAPKAIYRLARIDLRVHFDIASARTRLREVIDQYPASAEARDARPDVRFIDEYWDYDGVPLKYWYQASAAHRAGRSDEALALLDEMASEFSESKLVYLANYRSARILEDKGNVSGAIAMYQEVIRRRPESGEAADALERQRVLSHR